MLYEFPFLLEKNTYTKDNPKKEHIKLEYGLIVRIGREFPSGCGGDVGIRILHGSFQVSPKNANCWHKSDDFVIEDEPYYELFSEPYVLTIEGYNENTENDHTPIIRISILRPEKLANVALATAMYPKEEYVSVPE